MAIHQTSAELDTARLIALHSFRVVDDMAEPGLDRITRLAAASLGMSAAWVSLIDDAWLLPQACFGAEMVRAPRHGTPCEAAMDGEDAVFVATDLHRDTRFASDRLPAAMHGMHFYAGAVLVTDEGHRIGTLSVMDSTTHRVFSTAERGCLSSFAKLAMDRLESRRCEFERAAVSGFAAGSEFGFVSINGEGTFTFVNHAAETVFGYEPGAMLGQSVDIIIPEAFREAHRIGLARIASGGTSKLAGRTMELNAQHRNGTVFPIEFSLSIWPTPTGTAIGAMVRDITAWRARDAALVQMAHHDKLTGLANRAFFDVHLQKAIDQGVRPAILLLDLDGFKEVNDSLGHATGDALLQAVAIRLPLCTADGTIVARFGGDEFALLLPIGSDTPQVNAHASAILAAFQPPFHICGHTFHVGLSIGAAIGTDAGSGRDELVADADLALYQAKRDGRRCLRLFEPPMRSAVLARRTLHDELTRALESGELILHYQPQVDLSSGQVIGVEALLRWQHPQRGLLLPGAFLSALESHPLAEPVGRWIIEEACRQSAMWRAAGLPPIRVAVNLFDAQLKAGTLVDDVMRSLARYKLPPQTFEIEVTERIALQADDAVLDPIRELHANGVAIAFDDFGTGYASLSSLKRFPLTRLKIDRSFVRDLLTDRHDAEIIRAILGMAQSFGLDVIAEGIERVEQETVLRAMGCREGQGYLYGKAISAQAVSQLVKQGATRSASAA